MLLKKYVLHFPGNREHVTIIAEGYRKSDLDWFAFFIGDDVVAEFNCSHLAAIFDEKAVHAGTAKYAMQPEA